MKIDTNKNRSHAPSWVHVIIHYSDDFFDFFDFGFGVFGGVDNSEAFLSGGNGFFFCGAFTDGRLSLLHSAPRSAR